MSDNSSPSVPTTQGERDALRAIAEAATPGDWIAATFYPDAEADVGDEQHEVYATVDDEPMLVAGETTVDDGLFIATFDPPTVLALLDRLDELEATP